MEQRGKYGGFNLSVWGDWTTDLKYSLDCTDGNTLATALIIRSEGAFRRLESLGFGDVVGSWSLNGESLTLEWLGLVTALDLIIKLLSDL